MCVCKYIYIYIYEGVKCQRYYPLSHWAHPNIASLSNPEIV